jgi:hypothetical protein
MLEGRPCHNLALRDLAREVRSPFELKLTRNSAVPSLHSRSDCCHCSVNYRRCSVHWCLSRELVISSISRAAR